MCIEREKVNFKSREVNCLKECALALRSLWIGRKITATDPEAMACNNSVV